MYNELLYKFHTPQSRAYMTLCTRETKPDSIVRQTLVPLPRARARVCVSNKIRKWAINIAQASAPLHFENTKYRGAKNRKRARFDSVNPAI